MPPWSITIGLDSRRAASGVKAWSFDTTTNGIGRPCSEVPKAPSWKYAERAWSRPRKSRVSAYVEVARKLEASARVRSSGGTSEPAARPGDGASERETASRRRSERARRVGSMPNDRRSGEGQEVDRGLRLHRPSWPR